MAHDFHGNSGIARTLLDMARSGRIPQTLLLSGPSGVGKATLARRFGMALLPDSACIESDDLSLQANADIVAEREKWSSEKRNEDPLLFSTHPDFVTFPPDGPLRQITIQQMRLLKERAQFLPLRGAHRVFLIDHIDRANEQAANSLLKTLEEPPEHLVIVMTAENAYDLLPTIRSRAVMFHLSPLTAEVMLAFLAGRGLDEPERRLHLAAGSPGTAASLHLETHDRLRAAMLCLLRVASGLAPFSEWAKASETASGRKQDRLDQYLEVFYTLLEDLLLLQNGAGSIRNADLRSELAAVAAKVPFSWIRLATTKTDHLLHLVRRNIQKSLALDALVVELGRAA